MRISTPDKNYNTTHNRNANPSFQLLIKDPSALPIIKSMSKDDILELKQIEKRLSKTKFWDLKISAVGNAFKEFKFHFIDKKRQHGIISDGIYPYRREGDTINIYSIIYGPENASQNTVEALKFESADRAAEVYENYIQNLEMVRNKLFNLSPIESLKGKEIELNMLEEAARTPKKHHNLTMINSKFETTNKIQPHVSGETMDITI